VPALVNGSVPEITPVVALTLSEAGRPVALYVDGVPSGSLATSWTDTVEPSALVWFAGWLSVGAWFADDTVKVTPLLATPSTVTTTAPVVAPLGTGSTRLPALQEVGVATVPLNRTVLAARVDPKFAPLIVTEVPTAPDAGDTLAMAGAGPATMSANTSAERAPTWVPVLYAWTTK